MERMENSRAVLVVMVSGAAFGGNINPEILMKPLPLVGAARGSTSKLQEYVE